MRFLDLSGSNISIRAWKVATRPSKEALRKISILEWPCLMDGIQFVQGDVLSSACSINRFDPLHNFHLRT